MSVSESLVAHQVGTPGRFELLVTVANTGSRAGQHTVLAFLVRQYSKIALALALALVLALAVAVAVAVAVALSLSLSLTLTRCANTR